MKKIHLKSGLLLFGAYSFATSIAKLLHELGHGVYVWIKGGTVWYNINPFGTVYGVVNGDVNLDSAIYHWGGTISASLIGLALLQLVQRKTSPYFAPVIMTGVVCILSSGGNLLPGSVTNMIGDAARLIALGTPRWLIFITAIALLILGFYIAIKFLIPLTGLESEDSLLDYILVFAIGFFPYTIMQILYAILRHAGIYPVIFALITNVVVMLIAFMGKWYASQETTNWPIQYETIKWPHVISTLSLGILTIMLFIFVF